MMNSRILTGLLAALTMSAEVSAAEFKVIAIDNDFAQIFMTGEIVEGDAARFDEVARPYSGASVMLNSPGGLVSEALQRFGFGASPPMPAAGMAATRPAR